MSVRGPRHQVRVCLALCPRWHGVGRVRHHWHHIPGHAAACPWVGTGRSRIVLDAVRVSPCLPVVLTIRPGPAAPAVRDDIWLTDSTTAGITFRRRGRLPRLPAGRDRMIAYRSRRRPCTSVLVHVCPWSSPSGQGLPRPLSPMAWGWPCAPPLASHSGVGARSRVPVGGGAVHGSGHLR